MKLRKAKKIAVLGGTFDPIHYGHLAAAEFVREAYGMDVILFMPSGDPPHKPDTATPAEARLAMVALALRGNPGFCVSDLEIRRGGKTYTIDTARDLRRLCQPKARLFFILGADAVLDLPHWKEPEELLRLCEFIVVARPGWDAGKVEAHLAALRQRGGRFSFLEAGTPPVSSADLRGRLAAGRSVRYLLPPRVQKYIARHNLYADPITGAAPLRAYVKSVLSPKRYAHVLGVAAEAMRLAALHGADPNKAYVAGLLHDCAKEHPNKRALCERYKFFPDSFMQQKIDLAHGFLAAEIARRRFGVRGRNTLNAMRFHTTGRPGMSALEKVVLLADLVEPTRYPYEGLEALRALARENLNAAVRAGLQIKLEDTQGKSVIHPLTREAFEFYSALL